MEWGHFPSQTLPVSQDWGWNWSFVTAKNKTPLLLESRKLEGNSFFTIQTQKLWFSILIFSYCRRFFVLEIENIQLTPLFKSTQIHKNAAGDISGWPTKPPMLDHAWSPRWFHEFLCGSNPKESSACRRSWRSLGSGWLNWQIFWKLP